MNAPTNTTNTTPARGSTILVLGILSLVVCGLLGPFAWIMGKGDLEKMDQGRMDGSDRGMTKAGMICGMVATILLLLGVVVFVVAVLAQVSIASAGGL